MLKPTISCLSKELDSIMFCSDRLVRGVEGVIFELLFNKIVQISRSVLVVQYLQSNLLCFARPRDEPLLILS
jgi:hypothetical protein